MRKEREGKANLKSFFGDRNNYFQTDFRIKNWTLTAPFLVFPCCLGYNYDNRCYNYLFK